MRTPRLCSVLIATLVCLGGTVPASAQARVEWTLKPDLTLVPPGNTFLLETRGPTLFDFELYVNNDEDSTKLVELKEGFIRRVEVTLRTASGEVVAVNDGWRDEATCVGGIQCPSQARMVLPPRYSAVFYGAFVPVNGKVLGEGEYRIHMITTEAEPLIANEDGSTWNGRKSGAGSIAVQFRPARTEPERGLVAYSRGTKLNARGDHEGALRVFRGYLATNPGDAIATYHLGETLLFLHRLPEAASVLEPLVAAGPVRADSWPAGVLVTTYLAMDQDAKAEALLQQMNPPGGVAAAMKAAKANAARFRGR